jgi:hypothetical protein
MSYGNGSVVIGGNSLLPPRSAEEQVLDFERAGGADIDQGPVRGVYARHPAMTPKYHTGYAGPAGQFHNGALNKMARMYIVFPTIELRDQFLQQIKSTSPEALNYALALAGGSIGNKSAWRNNRKNPYGRGYIDFLLETAQETLQENAQVVNVLSDNYISYFFGTMPPVFRYSGWLLNSVQDDWRMSFLLMYQHITRGTQMARHRATVTFAYDSIIVTGVMMNLTQVLSAPMELAARFSFDFLVKRYDVIPPRMGPTSGQRYPTRVKEDDFADTITDNPRRTERSIADTIMDPEPTRAAASTQQESLDVFTPQDSDIYNQVHDSDKAKLEQMMKNPLWKTGAFINNAPATVANKLAGLKTSQSNPAD